MILLLSGDRHPPKDADAKTDQGLSTKTETKPGAVSSAKNEKKEKQAPGRKPLKDLFTELAPSVPMVKGGAISGSGFLIQKDGAYLVVTNRHVIEKAKYGVEVYFFPRKRIGIEEKLVIGPTEAKLIAIHRTVDMALIDVTSAADRIKALGIEPVKIAAMDQVCAVGEEVFAIGHPGGDNSTGV